MEVLSKTGALGFGGKGVSLSWLEEKGYPCPAFDLIDAGCWRSLLEGDSAQRWLRDVRYSTDQLAFSLACHELRERIKSGPLPDLVQNWVESDPFARLGDSLAVRSSALSEDGSSASSAGQYESVLGVSENGGLVAAIREVLASYYGERAVLYRRAQGIDESEVLAMGVIVQQLVPAAVSGIAFSVDPVSARPGVVIEASWGLGPPVVSGETEPDRFRCPLGGSGGAIEVSVGSKSTSLHYDPETKALRDSSGEHSSSPCIDTPQAAQIARAVEDMAGRFGMPVDVEWAIPAVGEPPLFLQIRPVTRTGAAPGDSAALMTTY